MDQYTIGIIKKNRYYKFVYFSIEQMLTLKRNEEGCAQMYVIGLFFTSKYYLTREKNFGCIFYTAVV